MIENIHIQNFKSIYDLEIDMGRVNLFIGENGSGKSNLLEALVFVSASESNKLDNEFLVSRGLRVPEPKLMRSAFSKENSTNNIKIAIKYSDASISYEFMNENQEYSSWKVNTEYNDIKELTSSTSTIENSINELDNYIDNMVKIIDEISELSTRNIELINEIEEKKNKLKPEIEFYKKLTKITEKNKKAKFLIPKVEDLKKLETSLKTVESKLQRKEEEYAKKTNNIYQFIIYSPENTSLRIFQKEGQIQPLGINGEGLLKLLQVINNYDNKNHIETIIESLQLFNWFENIEIPSDKAPENRVIIKDKYLYTEFDQSSANEGFLFILFYITLIVAKETPKAFAIDNIDASLNPKLCTKLITILVDLAKKYDKQVFLTTHNPAILDGINLNDEEQKLLVVSRNKKGYTRVKEITAKDKPKSSNNESLKLSEAFLRGYLGGLPKGF